jgi:hypothetical protein
MHPFPKTTLYKVLHFFHSDFDIWHCGGGGSYIKFWENFNCLSTETLQLNVINFMVLSERVVVNEMN